MEKREPSLTIKLVQSLWKNSAKVPQNFLRTSESSSELKTELSYDPEIPLLGIYLDNTIFKRDIITSIFIAALFTITKTCKQPKRSLTDNWVKNMWYIYINTMDNYSDIKKG